MPAFNPTSTSGAKALSMGIKIAVVVLIALAVYGIVKFATKPSGDDLYETELQRLTELSVGSSDSAKSSAQSCDEGNMTHCFELGWMYFTGEEWVNRNNQHSRRLIRRACDGGVEDACMTISHEQGPFSVMGM